MSDAIKLAGLWKSDKTTRDGKSYYKGKVQETVTIDAGSMVMLFLNDSENPNAPKFQVTVLPPLEPREPAPLRHDEPENGDFPW